MSSPTASLILHPLLPLRDIVVFPGMVAPLFVGRKRSIRALEDVVRQDNRIILLTQKDAGKDDPSPEDLYRIGTIASILQLLRLPDGTVKVLIEGHRRVLVKEVIGGDNFFAAEAEILDDIVGDQKDIKALMRVVVTQFGKYAALNKKIAPEILPALSAIKEPSKLADTIGAHLPLEIAEKQELLEICDIVARLERVFSFMEEEIEVLGAETTIRSRVSKQMAKTQKEYYLNEQLKAIHKELGDVDGKDEILQLEEKIKNTKLSTEALEKAKAEIKKLKTMSPMAAEATVVRNYLDWLLGIPWKRLKKTKKDINYAKDILDNDHYGLEKVKDRILEYIAVQQRTKKNKGPVLCLVGPPGVGKTSLAKSIAKAVGRNFVKISLGGVRDESEIRGHRRTYIGSMPGKVIQSMKKAKSSNPLILLDEIDKIGLDYRGDPAAALLEVLDGEQNSHFNDHYMEVDYNLSHVMFVATANTLNLQPALLDRLEIIRISGYTEDEKVEIAKNHLLSKLGKNHGLEPHEWSVTDEVLHDIIRYYTREAGVRNLEREIAKIARKVVRNILVDSLDKINITSDNLSDYLGVRKFSFGETGQSDVIGVVTGLAYTEVGGDLLSIEAVQLPGKGNIKCTGKLGDVMQESAQAAFSYARSRAGDYGITPLQYQKRDLHIHVPEGATPKDGPSAGIAMCTAIVSAMTGIPIKKTIAMTGEITLRGRVLAIGGLKEKLLAALRGGVKTVILPKENEKDMAEIPENVKQGINFFYVSHIDEVLKIALTRMPKPVAWQEYEEIDPVITPLIGDNQDEIVTH